MENVWTCFVSRVKIENDLSHARNCGFNTDTSADTPTNHMRPSFALDHQIQLTGPRVHRCWGRLTGWVGLSPPNNTLVLASPNFLLKLVSSCGSRFKSPGGLLVLHETHHSGRRDAVRSIQRAATQGAPGWSTGILHSHSSQRIRLIVTS